MQKVFLNDGTDISPKFFWDDSSVQEEKNGAVLDDEDCFEQVVKEIKDAYGSGDVHTFYMKDDAATTRDLQLERENAFFVPGEEENGNSNRVADAVNHPSHYTCGSFEVIDILKDQLTEEQFKGFCLGNALKYICRSQHKGHFIEDLRKAVWYLNRLTEN